jgi:RsiW-degrading membrane proteinase PrsW (M82 family)
MAEQGIKTIKIHKPDFKEKIFFLFSGILVSIPISLFFSTVATRFIVVLPISYAYILASVIFAPLIEEFAKAYPLFFRHGETERSIFILGLLVGLGFGITEFFIYVILLGVPIYVRLPGILFHAASTSIVAYGIAKKKTIIFFLIAVYLHLSNNLFAIYHNLIGIALVNIITYYLSLYLYTQTSEKFIDEN